MVRKRIAMVGAVAASVSIVWISAADAQTDPPPSTIPTTIASTTPTTRPTTTRPQPSTTDVIEVTTTTRRRTTTTTTTRRSGRASTTIAGVVTPTTTASDTATSIDSPTSSSIGRTTTSGTPRTTSPALPSTKNDKSKLLLLAALAAGGVAVIALIAWGLSLRNGPGADGPFLVLDDGPMVFGDEGLLLDEPTAGPGGDPFGPSAVADTAAGPARPPKKTRATYKRKPKTQPHLTDEEVSAVVAPGAPIGLGEPNPTPEPEPFFPPEPGAEPFFASGNPVARTDSAAPFPPAFEPEPPLPPAPEPVVAAARVARISPTPPRVAVPEIEDIDLAAPMNLAPDDVSMDIDLGDPQP